MEPIARHVVITGASTGIGYECALHLAQRGWIVWAGVRREADGAALASDPRARAGTPGQLRPVILDVTDGGSIAAAAATIGLVAGSAGLQGLVNNAGIGVGGPVERVPLDDWRRQFEVNLFGVIAVTQAFLPLLRAHVQGRGGAAAGGRGAARIVMMSSIAGRVSQPMLSPYAASKFALEAVSDALRLELRAQGIRTCLIEPGPIQSEIWRKGDETIREKRALLAGDTHYEPLLPGIERLARDAVAKALPASTVAAAVERSLASVRPRARTLITRDAKVAAFLKHWLPTPLFDRLIAGAFGIR